MKNLKFQSVFDIIGPVMVGPSSSHTAGAVRIGKIVSAIFGDAPTEVEFQLFNSFAKTYRGHGTDVALVAGILGMETDNPDIPHALDIAHEKGIKVYWKINKDSKAPHPNTTRITLKNATKTISATGISIGGGNIQVTDILSRYGINIAQMTVTRENAGEKAIMIIEVDSHQCDEAVADIARIPNLHNVNFFS